MVLKSSSIESTKKNKEIKLNKFKVIIKKLIWETPDILRLTLVDPNNAQLPQWNAGAHIDIHLENNLIRQYSLSNDPANSDHYEIAVLKEKDGRGGSQFIHDTFSEGLEIEISKPQNHFQLAPEADFHIFLAGGIGITPIMAMIAELENQKKNYVLHYCTRTIENTAFHDRLSVNQNSGKIYLHHDNGNPKLGFNFKDYLKNYKKGTSLYYCGPPSFMDAIKLSTKDWPPSAVHCEYFSSPDNNLDIRDKKKAFKIKIASTGKVFTVPPESTIVEILRKNNFLIDTSCEDGFCGTCMTRYIEGEPEHRDSVLDDEDRKQFVLICCAGSKTPTLVLDL